MSDYFKIIASTHEYEVRIGNDILNATINDPAPLQQQIIICDQFFAPTYQAQGFEVISIVADEAAKSLDQMSEVIVALRALGANRQTRLVAIGGGIIQDIVTFVASVYMRGVEWILLPTTLLGMVDACIGGKSSINVGQYKNLIGNFYPPRNIFIDCQFINTLNETQRIAGLCEAVKICFAAEAEQPAFEHYIALNPGVDSALKTYQELISLSLLTKRWFIEIDEYDQKERLLLNFGHTFGHAIESASSFTIPHGIAVGIGMLAAIACARLNHHFETTPQRVTQLERYVTTLLSKINTLPMWINHITIDTLITHFDADKKHTKTHYVVIVPNSTGHLIRLKLEKKDVNRALISAALHAACQQLLPMSVTSHRVSTES